jgi:DNA invertase Pin-like site-specific DNA recombinase
MGIDTRGNGSNSTTRLQLTILAAVVQFEKELMLERQKEGIAKAQVSSIGERRQWQACRQFLGRFQGYRPAAP